MNFSRRDCCKALVACTAILSIQGCTTFALNKLAKLPLPAVEHPPVQAARMLCLWQPAEGVGLDGLPSRGVVGQVFFFGQNTETPIVVDGDVRIFLFDDRGTAEEQAKPLHQFDFLSEGWQTQLYETQLGPTYQVFIPYVRKGNQEVECALRVRLTPKTGQTIYSDMAYVVLPGAKLEKNAGESKQSPATASNEMTEIEKTVAEGLQKLRGATFAKRGKSNSWELSDAPNASAKPAQATADATATAAHQPPDADQRLERIEQALAQLLEERQAGNSDTVRKVDQAAVQDDAEDGPPIKRFRMKTVQ